MCYNIYTLYTIAWYSSRIDWRGHAPKPCRYATRYVSSRPLRSALIANLPCLAMCAVLYSRPPAKPSFTA
jgi:hypothetical protein